MRTKILASKTDGFHFPFLAIGERISAAMLSKRRALADSFCVQQRKNARIKKG